MHRIQRNTLIVDDEAGTRTALAGMLSDVGRCTCCASADEAVGLLGRSSFDVVVSDIRMPGLSGFDLLALINGQSERPKVVLVSGDTPPHWVRRALKAGAYDIIQKPLDPLEFKKVVQQAAVANDEERRRRCNSAKEAIDAYDPLTGLLSHREFLDALMKARGVCRHGNDPLSLLMIDLDRFRKINDNYGHDIGDRVLAWVGQSLRNECRAGDILSRYHWDRFAVALPGCRETEAGEFANRLEEVLFRAALPMDKHRLQLRGAIGVAESSPGFVESGRDLIERAEQALACAKHEHGRRVVAFSATLNQRFSRDRLEQASLDDVVRWVGATRQQLKKTYIDSTRALVEAVEAKDPYTRRHSLAVSHHAEAIGQRLDLPAGQLESLKLAAILHDVGKIGVPDAILRKPGPLSRDEFELIKQHPKTAVKILGHATFLDAEMPMILHHHERWDGTGYPNGLAGRDIPFGARILAVADALDAMLSCRSYKLGFTVDRTRRELQDCSGQQWDPVAVDAALQWLDSCPEPLSTP